MSAEPEQDQTALQAVLDAVSSPVRREILWMVWNDELAAGEIADAFDITAPTISSHLAALREAGLVTLRVDGNYRRYRADRDAMALLVPLLASGNERWLPADDIPERDLADAVVQQWVQVTADVPGPPDEVFQDFVDGERYSAWLGVPVALHDGRFSTELEWGTKVRGHYEVVVPPSLIAMRWDFEDDAIPVPGAQLVAYLRLAPAPGGGTHVEIHQCAPTSDQADFLSAAWALVLGRLREHREHGAASASPRRARRPKRTR